MKFGAISVCICKEQIFHSFSTQQNQTLFFSLCLSFSVFVKHDYDAGFSVEGKVGGPNPVAGGGVEAEV